MFSVCFRESLRITCGLNFRAGFHYSNNIRFINYSLILSVAFKRFLKWRESGRRTTGPVSAPSLICSVHFDGPGKLSHGGAEIFHHMLGHYRATGRMVK